MASKEAERQRELQLRREAAREDAAPNESAQGFFLQWNECKAEVRIRAPKLQRRLSSSVSG